MVHERIEGCEVRKHLKLHARDAHQIKLAGFMPRKRLGGTDPDAVHRFDRVVHTRLPGRRCRYEKTRIEPAWAPERGHKAVQKMNPINREPEPLARADIGERQLARVQRVAVGMKPCASIRIGIREDVSLRIVGKQQTRFLEALAYACDPVAAPLIAERALLRALRLRRPDAPRIIGVQVVVAVNAPAGKHVHAPGKRRRAGTPQHEDLESRRNVPHQDHGRGRANGLYSRHRHRVPQESRDHETRRRLSQRHVSRGP